MIKVKVSLMPAYEAEPEMELFDTPREWCVQRATGRVLGEWNPEINEYDVVAQIPPEVIGPRAYRYGSLPKNSWGGYDEDEALEVHSDDAQRWGVDATDPHAVYVIYGIQDWIDIRAWLDGRWWYEVVTVTVTTESLQVVMENDFVTRSNDSDEYKLSLARNMIPVICSCLSPELAEQVHNAKLEVAK